MLCSSVTRTTLVTTRAAMRNHHDWSLSLPSNSTGESPKAIVVLIGWWGAKPRQLQKYADIYSGDDLHTSDSSISPKSIITLSGVADPRALMIKNDAVLRDYAQKGLGDVARLLQQHPRLPVVFHVFSNGGGFVWEQMEQIIKEHEEEEQAHQVGAAMDTEQTPLHRNSNLSLVRRSIRGQIFDSCPAYPSWNATMAALEGSGLGSKSYVVLIVLKTFLSVWYALESTCNWICRKPHRMMKYWNQLLDSELGPRQAFIYSTSDHVTDSTELEAFMDHRRSRGSKISVLKLHDSNHVQHFREHPHLYKHFVQKFMDEILDE
jgi:hypothetical protein